MKIAAVVEYDGSNYSGWQRQKHSASVQEYVETALSAVADHPLTVTCAGRTDAGVHALNQVIHFESDALRDAHSWVLGMPPPGFRQDVPGSLVIDRRARFHFLQGKIMPGKDTGKKCVEPGCRTKKRIRHHQD